MKLKILLTILNIISLLFCALSPVVIAAILVALLNNPLYWLISIAAILTTLSIVRLFVKRKL